MPQPVSSPRMSVVGTFADAANWPHLWTSNIQADHPFIAMLNAYRPSGGLGRIRDFLQMLQRQDANATLKLAHWILKRQVIFLKWRAITWLPWFQFGRGVTTPQPELAPVFAELATVFDPWKMAIWFARPTSWLAKCRPAESSRVGPTAVLLAAQADRFLAGG